MTTHRSVDTTGLVWQVRPAGGVKIIGEIHRTRAGRYYVVMVGRRIATSLRTWNEAVVHAMTWQPEGEDVDLLATILRGYEVAS